MHHETLSRNRHLPAILKIQVHERADMEILVMLKCQSLRGRSIARPEDVTVLFAPRRVVHLGNDRLDLLGVSIRVAKIQVQRAEVISETAPLR